MMINDDHLSKSWVQTAEFHELFPSEIEMMIPSVLQHSALQLFGGNLRTLGP